MFTNSVVCPLPPPPPRQHPQPGSREGAACQGGRPGKGTGLGLAGAAGGILPGNDVVRSPTGRPPTGQGPPSLARRPRLDCEVLPGGGGAGDHLHVVLLQEPPTWSGRGLSTES